MKLGTKRKASCLSVVSGGEQRLRGRWHGSASWSNAWLNISRRTACQVLDSFYQLAQRERSFAESLLSVTTNLLSISFHFSFECPGVKTFVEKKGESLYLIFLNELNHNIKKEFDQFRKLPSLPIIQGHPMYAGPALAVRGLMLRIQLQMAELDQLCYLECREQENCRDVFNTLHGNMETFVLTNFQDWVQELKRVLASKISKMAWRSFY